MIRNLKVLGLALAAVFAFSGVASSAAFATEEEFHCTEVEHCIIKASQEEPQVFNTEAGTTSCTAVSGEGTITGQTAMQVAAKNISYTGCTTTTIFGKINVTVSFNGCEYLFTTSTQPVHLICPAGKEVTIVGPGCSITVSGGQTLNEIHYGNTATGGTTMAIGVAATVTNITSHGTGAFCTKQGTFTNGTYNGRVTFTCQTTLGVHTGCTYS